MGSPQAASKGERARQRILDSALRLFSRQAHLGMDFVTTPERLQLMASSADNFIRHFNVGRTFDMSGSVPRLGADVPRWFGESVAFWDQDTLITLHSGATILLQGVTKIDTSFFS